METVSLNNRGFLYIIVIIFFTGILTAAGSESNYNLREPQQSRIAEYKKNPDFIYKREPVKISFIEAATQWINDFLNKYFEKPLKDVNFSKIKYAAIVVALSMIIFIILKTFRSEIFERKKRKKNEMDIFSVIDDVYNPETDELINRYLEEHNYTIVIRLYFNKVLKILAEKNIIIWEKNKTNKQYYYDIKDTNLKQTFNEFSNIFDHVWYGNFEVNDTLFKKIEKLYYRIEVQAEEASG